MEGFSDGSSTLPASTNLIPGRTPETAIIALSYGFVLAAQIKSKL